MSAAVAGTSRGGAQGARGGSNGGGRGRGRGRGGFGGAGSRLVNMGAMTMGDIMDVSATQGTGRHSGRVPYPTMEAEPEVTPPSLAESRAVEATLNFMRAQRSTPWWVREEPQLFHGAGKSKARLDLVDETHVPPKRGPANVLRYSDRKRLRQVEEQAREASDATPAAAAPINLTDPSIAKLLCRDTFPMDLWRSYMRGESRRQERKDNAQRRKRDRSWKDVMDRMEMGGATGADGAAALAGADNLSDLQASGDEEEDAAADEYEDDEEDDYADNYFDNGEEDDIGDAGGGEAEADFE